MIKGFLVGVAVLVAVLFTAVPADAQQYPPVERPPGVEEVRVEAPRAPAPEAAPTPADEALPVTGGESALLVRVAVGMVAGGGILLLAARRRRATASIA